MNLRRVALVLYPCLAPLALCFVTFAQKYFLNPPLIAVCCSSQPSFKVLLSLPVQVLLPVPAALCGFLLDTCGEHLPRSFLTVHTLKKGKGCLWFLAGNRPNMVPMASALRGEAIQTSSRSSTQPYFIVFCCKTCDQVNGKLAVILFYALLLERCWLPSELNV